MNTTFHRRRSTLAAHRAGTGKRAGMSLLEVVISTGILIGFLGGLTTMVTGTHQLRRVEDDRRVAEAAIQSAAEEVRALSAASIGDDAGWAQTLMDRMGDGEFDVFGLSPRDGEASVGTVQLIVDETTTDEDLGFDLGLPRDLDDDGLATNVDVSGGAVLVPVFLKVRWQGAFGPREIMHGFYLLGY